ncbi:putative glutamine--tRNA ligase [Dictyocoela muelleri]|nr:putative glutamine--tRNA ligase [Dictyocoela muelleri]
MDFDEKFNNLKIPQSKKDETLKNPKILNNLKKIFTLTDSNNKLLYILATLINDEIDVKEIINGIENNQLTNEKMLRGAVENVKKGKSLNDFLENLHFEDFDDFVEENLKLGKNKLLKKIYSHGRFRYVDGERLKELVEKLTIEENEAKENIKQINKDAKDNENVNIQNDKEDVKKVLYEEGLLTLLHKPGENPQLNEKIRDEHLKRTGGKVVTRFPPEPNGYLHIGHAKALNLDFGYAEKYGGVTYLRFDDTNPRNEKEEYYQKIIEEVEWLGFKPFKITAASDYFDQLIQFAFVLIDKGLAYCCHQTKEEIQDFRKCNKPSPWRDRSPAVNHELFQEMIDGKWPEKSISLRLKMDHTSKNPLLHDLIAYRVIKQDHIRAKKKYNVYPSYDYTHCINDSLEDITHSFCSREFYSRRESYYWVVDNLEIYRPVQWEFSRLNISNTVLSKRKLTKLVDEKIVDGWDDPRLYTISGLRRRGFPPVAINKFARSVGITCSESIIDVKILENFVRDELNATARRVMAVRDPIKLIIENFEGPEYVEIEDFPNSDKKISTKRTIRVKNEIFIDKNDFSLVDDPNFHRLSPTQSVGLYKLFAVKFKRKLNDAILVTITDEKPKKFIQWVSDPIKIKMKMYSPLFKSFNPEEVDMMKDINFNSLEIVNGYADKRILNCQVRDVFQFQRIGYFCVDEVKNDEIVFNLTILLKNS